MNRRIRFSKSASAKLENLLVYLEIEWSMKVKENFIVKLDSSLLQIQNHPDSFPASEKINGLRKCVVTKQTTIFYKYSDQAINVVAIFDNRQDPNSQRYLL
ncbi:type II toxin-antitoxin system RelE/ParE family toxin [bacterium]|jgi:plasmid stabilization system protein ParE|nr:type II toxin-antitoxin system RelE/ParE family toxin [bacterium]